MKATFLLIAAIICLAFCGSIWACGHNKRSHEDVKDGADHPLILEDRDSSISVPLGCDIEYSYSVHGSVGYSYHVEYDEEAFSLSKNMEYNNPDAVAKGMCGGDKAVLTTTLTPKQKGKFTVKIIHTFRGTVERVTTYNISVE